MNKTRSCELIWRLIFVCGLGHHPKTPPNTAWPWIGTDSHHWTGCQCIKEITRSAWARTESHPIGVGLNINPATDVRGYSHWEAGTKGRAGGQKKALQNQCQYIPHQQRSPSRVARQSRESMATPKNKNATDQLYQRITGVNQSLVFAILSECHVCVLFLH